MDAFEEMNQRLKDEHLAIIQEILDANQDLQERAASLGMLTVYDEEDDILRAIIGQPTEAATESIEHTIRLRVEPETLKLVGIEVLGFKALMSAAGEADSPTLRTLRAVAATLGEHHIETEQAGAQVARSLRELVTA
ncbi:MAG: hypothetical protein ACRDJE_05905 [Dehalococcoidia bacterium]